MSSGVRDRRTCGNHNRILCRNRDRLGESEPVDCHTQLTNKTTLLLPRAIAKGGEPRSPSI